MAEGRLFYARPEPLTCPPQAAVKLKRHRTESAISRSPGLPGIHSSRGTWMGYRLINQRTTATPLAVAPLKVAAD
jgi:hypothetical protein